MPPGGTGPWTSPRPGGRRLRRKKSTMDIPLDDLKSLIATLEAGGVNEFEYEDEKSRLRLSFGPTGVVAAPVFEDNQKAWSGDHCIDPRLVPGVFFCNRKVEAREPALIDIAPTALRLFGIDPPPYMDGKPLAGLA